MTLRVLIVDDEPLARRRVRALLAGEPDVEIAGEAGSGQAAVDAIGRLAPDLVFLDVQMPGLDGFQVLGAVPPPLPAIIFVTAHDEHALRAFEVHAVDYLMKPFRRERFVQALRRARERLAARDDGRIAALLESLAARSDRLAVRDGAEVTFVPTGSIDWLEADGNYVKIHAGPLAHLSRDTMAGLEARLDPRRFLRIHRSVIVNVERLARLVPAGRNDSVAVLLDGTRLPVGRAYRDRMAALRGG